MGLADEEAHTVWLRRYLGALGLNPDVLKQTPQTPSSHHLQKIIERWTKEGRLGSLCGLLLYFEWSIGFTEYPAYRTARDLLFPEVFVEDPTDPFEVAEAKRLARMFLDHHIWHDLDHHYPGILFGIAHLVGDTEGQTVVYAQILAGVLYGAFSKLWFHTEASWIS